MATRSLIVWCLVHCVHSRPGYEPPYGERLQPKPFKYQYGLLGAGGGFTKKEVQDADGNIEGEVVVSLPDGRIQTTRYNADFYDGYNADIEYTGTASYPPPKNQHQAYNSKTFIPVHLKSKPKVHAVHQKPRKNIYTATPTYPRYQTFPHRNKQILLPELKSVEIPVESKEHSDIVFEPEKLKSVKRPESNSVTKQSGTKPKLEKLSISGLSESIDMVLKVKKELENSKKIEQSEKLILSPIESEQPIFQNTPQIEQETETKNSGFPTLTSEIESEKIRKKLQKNEKEIVAIIEETFENTSVIPEMLKIESKVKQPLSINSNALPSLNPETPPLMVIKSHVKDKTIEENADIIEGTLKSTPQTTRTESKVKHPMSIKSKVLSTPKPAESMEMIMEKIRKDLTNRKGLNQARLSTVSTKLEPAKTRKGEESPDSVQEMAMEKSAKNAVKEFMKKVELMKEKKLKSGKSNIDEDEVVTKTSATTERY